MHAYKKKDENPQKVIDSQGISIEKTGYCRGNFSLKSILSPWQAFLLGEIEMDESEIVSLEDWVYAEAWRESHARSVFPTHDSWIWFKRRHRRTLVESGVLVLGSGRVRDSVDTKRISAVILAIRRRESIARMSGYSEGSADAK
jgi:hypothetical protein